jgi:menaquinone-dependent protoporphyrinogen oxidase
MRIVLLYGSDEHQTEKIANYIADIVISYGHQPFCLNMKYLPNTFDLRGYDRIMIGASIHAGQYQRYVIDWIHHNKHIIRSVTNAFFSVSMVASKKGLEAEQEIQSYINTFIQETEWHPNHIASFAGALRFQEYSFFKKLLVQRLMTQKGIEVDIEQNIEFTDWGRVADFALAFLQ